MFLPPFCFSIAAVPPVLFRAPPPLRARRAVCCCTRPQKDTSRTVHTSVPRTSRGTLLSFALQRTGSHCARRQRIGFCPPVCPSTCCTQGVLRRTPAGRQPRIKLMYELQTRDAVCPMGSRLPASSATSVGEEPPVTFHAAPFSTSTATPHALGLAYDLLRTYVTTGDALSSCGG